MAEEEPFKRIDVAAARELIEQGVRVIDVREPKEWATGHVPQAELVPLNQILSKPLDYIKPDQKTIFICQVGGRSAVACEMAAAVGASDIYNVEGGTAEWISKGFPVTQ